MEDKKDLKPTLESEPDAGLDVGPVLEAPTHSSKWSIIAMNELAPSKADIAASKTKYGDGLVPIAQSKNGKPNLWSKYMIELMNSDVKSDSRGK